VLRRSHDHHQGLRARRDASPSTNRSHHRSPDRHLVTALKPLRKFVRLHGWSPAAAAVHARISNFRPNLARNTPRAAKLSPYLSAAAPSAASFKRRARHQANCPRCSNLHSAHGTSLVPPARFPPLEVFGRRPQRSRHHLHAAGIRKPSHKRISGQQKAAIRSPRRHGARSYRD